MNYLQKLRQLRATLGGKRKDKRGRGRGNYGCPQLLSQSALNRKQPLIDGNLQAEMTLSMSKQRSFLLSCGIVMTSIPSAAIYAGNHIISGTNPDIDTAAIEIDQTVHYSADFFAQYRPNTALDMVRLLPGFQLDDGADTRGYTNSTGNILINSRPPNVKQDTPSAILRRIPANNVESIDLVRGRMTGIDMLGQAVVANIHLQENAVPSIRWEAFIDKGFDHDMVMWGGAISVIHGWKGIQYNTGLEGDRHGHSRIGTRNSYDVAGNLTEDRNDDAFQTHSFISGSLNTSTMFRGAFLEFNSRIRIDDSSEHLVSDRIPQFPGSTPRQELFGQSSRNTNIELGINAKREMVDDLTGKIIVLFTQSDRDEISDQTVLNTGNIRTLFRIAEIETITTEAISRLEFDWVGLQYHQIQFDIEGTYNVLDGSLMQSLDTGNGLVHEYVPGSNTRVEEYRGDFLLSDTWNLAVIEIEYGLGGELSTISQSGDAELKRDFFFLKPKTMITYTPGQDMQARLQVTREVSQLDFKDFVSSVALQDNNLTLGNPYLRPENTWKAELGYEHRFGPIGVVSIAVFHHWISDVEDLLPLTPVFEAPGNIGDGKRWGLKLEGSMPLDWLGLPNSRLDVRSRWLDSRVIDPVTGKNRTLSGTGGISGPVTYREEDLRYQVELKFRQDFEAKQIAWGWDMRTRGKRTLFKINELDVYNEGLDVNAFIETTRWFGIKTSVVGKYLFDARKRDRTIYTGQRERSEIDRIEKQEYTLGGQIALVLSGNF